MSALLKTNIILLLVFIFKNVSIPQSQLYFDGYLLNLGSVQMQKTPLGSQSNNKFQNINRLRIRPRLEFNEDITLTIEHETFILYKNGNEFHSEKYEKIMGQLVNLHFTLLNNSIWQITHFIDRLHLMANIDRFNITLGRQRIAWGTGRIWNPTDMFNPINPTNFAKIEKDGVDAVLMKYNFSSLTDLSIVINPAKHRTNFALRFRTNFSEFDVSFMSGKFNKNIVYGIDFAGNLLNAGVRGEMLVSSQIIKYILGMDYQFSPKIYSLIEYHFNGAGKSKKENYNFYDLITNNSIYLARSYINFQLLFIVHPLSTISILLNRNLNDESRYFSLNLSYSILENLNLNWITNIFFGKENTEYWYYPSSLGLRLEYFF